MTNPLEQLKEEVAQTLFGRSRTIAMSNNQCVVCGEFNLEFRDELSRKEYGISGMCQCCQDSVFNTEEEEEE